MSRVLKEEFINLKNGNSVNLTVKRAKSEHLCYWCLYEKSERFTISEAAADWNELMMIPAVDHAALANSWNHGAARRHTTAPVSPTGLHFVAHHLLICHPAE